ncbi:MAG TPA: hypothetical protein VF923_04240 [Gemmatimonadales bacterium]
MYVIVWEFQVSAARLPDFERAYGPGGDWAAFFKRSDAYRGAELLRAQRDDDGPTETGGDLGYYWTIDRWDSREAYETFNERFDAEYAAMDTRFAELCDLEVCLGKFEMI